jgi:menaquinone-dependent protoporphyrinogen oxidase
MRILVTWASKHGSTADIAHTIGGTLREHGAHVEMCPIDSANLDDAYDAYVIGSAVYAGHWMKQAKEFVKRHRATLIPAPVWLFSSGPLGHPPQPADATIDVADLFANTAPHEHRIFGGKLDKAQLSFPEKAIVAALHAPDGDFRDWDEIRSWADRIANALQPKEVHA